MNKIKTFNEYIKQKNLSLSNTERLNVTRQVWEALKSEKMDRYFRKPVMMKIDNERIKNTFFDIDLYGDFYQQEVGWFEGIYMNKKPSLVCPWNFSKDLKNCNIEITEFIVNKDVQYRSNYDKFDTDISVRFHPFDTTKKMKREYGLLRYSIKDDVWYWDENYMGRLMEDEVSGDVAKFISVITTAINPNTKYTLSWFQNNIK